MKKIAPIVATPGFKQSDIAFSCGKCTIKKARIITAKVYDRQMSEPENMRDAFPGPRFELYIRICKGVWQQAAFKTLEELMPHLQKHLGMDYGKI